MPGMIPAIACLPMASRAQLRVETAIERTTSDTDHRSPVVGVSAAIRTALALAERYARTRLPVLLVGATGTGKEIFAQHIHRLSGRHGRLVDVNCCALARDLAESLLFGHRRGAFTGSFESTIGHVERADGGTLFLDELTSLVPEAQGKLLRVIETGEVQALGASVKRQVDFRLVSAVQEDVGIALETGRFRRDLFQRVAGVIVKLPTLSARPEDVFLLAEHFAALGGRRLEAGVEATLLEYSWPGNVRELRMVIERAGTLVENGMLTAQAIADAIALGRVGEPNVVSRPSASDTLLQICEAHGWHGSRICQALGIGRTTLYLRLQQVGVSLRQAKKDRIVRNC